jgi:hypothetical protein
MILHAPGNGASEGIPIVLRRCAQPRWRHTFASLLLSGGMSLLTIGKLLGHTQVETTARYAHLFDDPFRVGLDQVGEMLRTPLKVVHADSSG